MLAFVKLQITFSVSMYIMCVMFVRHFELRDRRFTNVHDWCYCLWADVHLEKVQETKVLLERLQEEGKNLFLISNSGFPFM